MSSRKAFFRLIKRSLAVLGLGLLVLVAILLYNTFSFSSSQLEVQSVAKAPVPDSVVAHLSQAIQYETISYEDSTRMDSAVFLAFRNFLNSTYPLADSLLDHELINEFSHLYHWRGENPALKPILLAAHTDVVPVDEKDLPDWDHEPFGGALVDGVVWGRGTLDDKSSVLAILEAAEMLLRRGFQPERSIYLAFGHDEEVRGRNGAPAIAELLKNRGVQLEMALDEGFFITQKLVPDLDPDLAFIGIAEKGYVSIEATVQVEGGHSAIPNPETAIGVMGDAIARVQANPLTAHVTTPMQGFIDKVGPEMPFTSRMAFANLWLFKPLILSTYAAKASGNALIRTTLTPTIVQGGTKANVVPQFVSATFNSRILPGETKEDVLEHLRSTIDDERFSYKILPGHNPASRISSTDSRAYKVLATTIKESFGPVLTSPNLVVGGTDGYFYEPIADDVYRFLPMYLNEDNLHTFHGIDERLPAEQFKDAIRFYARLMENLCGKATQ